MATRAAKSSLPSSTSVALTICQSLCLAGLLFITTGCSVFRIGALPTPTLGTFYVGLDDLGRHGSVTEGHGIAYTGKAGHIDVDHVRISADWTRRISDKSVAAIMSGHTRYEFMSDWTLYRIDIEYLDGWASVADKEKIARTVAIDSAATFAFYIGTWHEIATWYGWSSTGIYSEDPSSFSWEDNVSNVVGCQIGRMSLLDNDGSFNDAVTKNFADTMRQLDIKDSRTARKAAEAMCGKWYAIDACGLGSVDMRKRNFDLGLDTGYVTPWLVPMPGCDNVKPEQIPLPEADDGPRHRIRISMSIRPEFFERRRILKAIYPNNDGEWIMPKEHYRPIMEQIRKDAVERYGPDVANP